MEHEYSSDEIVARFQSLLLSFDFVEEMEIIALGKIHFKKRKKTLIEIKALYIALWGLAVEKSFPDHAKEIFDLFLDKMQNHFSFSEKDTSFLKRRIDVYNTMLEPNKENNFSEIANYIVQSAIKQSDDFNSKCLKFSLKVRNVYNLIFEKLI